MSMPHVAYEYGILIRDWALALVSGGDECMKESGDSGGYMDGVRGGGGKGGGQYGGGWGVLEAVDV